jgi:hypothetical protein
MSGSPHCAFAELADGSGTTRNRVTRKGPGVRIPPSPFSCNGLDGLR